MVNSVIQPSFAGGEFSPQLRSRVDLQKYYVGLGLARNMIIHPTGGMSNRPGLRFVAEAKYADKRTRLIPFEFSVTQAYIIEFGDYYCRFYRDGGQILASSLDAYSAITAYVVGDMVSYLGVNYICIQDGTGQQPDVSPLYWTAQDIYEIATPYTEDEIFDLKFVQSADVLFIVHPDHYPRQLERFNHDDWELNYYLYENGPFRASNIEEIDIAVAAVTGTGVAMTASVDTFDPLHVGALWQITHDLPSQSVNSSFTSTGQSSSISCGGTWRIITHGTWTGVFKIEKSTDGGSTWEELRQYSSANDFNVNTFGEEDSFDPVLLRINVTSYTSGTINVDLSSDPYTQNGIVEIVSYTDAQNVTVDVLKDLGSTDATSDWSEGAWSDFRGFPSCVTFYQERLCFAATYFDPQTVWMSNAGNYYDFRRSFPLEDTDGITINLPSRKMNGIKNLVGLSTLIALTSASEWSISGGNDPLTPTTVQTKVEGYRGSAENVTPIVIGNRIIFVQRMGATVRDLGYDFGVDGFQGDILNIYSNHLLRGYVIDDMDYQEEPDNLVWFVRNDGELLSLTYLREQEVLAWAHHDTQGYFRSVATIPVSEYNEVWVVVERGTKQFIERMEIISESTDPRQHYYFDSGLSYNDPLMIESMTNDAIGVFTITSHGLNNDDVIDIFRAKGFDASSVLVEMEDLNEKRFIVANATTHTFTLKDYDSGDDIDTTNFETYLQDGEVHIVTSALSGFDHLEGMNIGVLADGSVLTERAVSGGGITLDYASSVVHAGLSYVSEFETLNVEIQSNQGTIQGKYVHIPSVIIRFINSGGGKAGIDEDTLDEVIQRTDEALGQPTRLYNEDFQISLDSEYRKGGKIFFRQDKPLPVRILAIIPDVVVGGK